MLGQSPRYVGNNPLTYVDPWGLSAVEKNWWEEWGDYANVVADFWTPGGDPEGLPTDAWGYLFGHEPGDIFTVGSGAGFLIPLGDIVVPVGFAVSLDRVIMKDGQADWFLTVGGGLSTPGPSVTFDRGRTKARNKSDFVGKSVSVNADVTPVGVELIKPGWDPAALASEYTTAKGGIHIGEGANLFWNYTWDIGN